MFRSSRLCRLCLIEVNAVVPIFATKDVAETSSIQMKIMELANVQVYAGDGLPSNVCSNCNTLLDSYHAFKTQIEKSDVILRHQLSTSQTDPLSLDGKEVEGTGHGEFVKAETLIIKDEEIDEDHVESIIHPTSAPSLSSPLPDTSIINDDEDEDENEDDDDGDDHDNDPGADEMDVDDDETQTDPLASDPVESPLDQLSTSNKPATSVADANVTTPQSIPLVTSTSSIPLVSSATPIIANPPGNLLLVATPLIINSGNEPGKPNSVTPTSSFVALPTNVSSTFVTVPTSAIKAPTPTATVTSGSIKKKPKRKTTVKKEKVSEVSAEPGPSTSTAEPTEESASTSAGGDPLQVRKTVNSNCMRPQYYLIIMNKTMNNGGGTSVPNNKAEEDVKSRTCDICNIVYQSQQILKMHQESIHLTNINCMPTTDKLIDSVATDDAADDLQNRTCDVCNKIFKCQQSLKIHNESIHTIPVECAQMANCSEGFETVDDEVEDLKKRTCDICNKVYRSKKNLKTHKENLHSTDIKYVSCEICHKLFKTKYFLKTHMRLVHLTKRKKYKCVLCGKRFKTKCNMRSHFLTRHSRDDAKVNCTVCHKTFKNVVALKGHTKSVHSDRQLIVCEICGKSYKDLNYHIKYVHSENVVASCDICGKQFRNENLMKRHKVCVHPKTREFVCETCGAQFKLKETLTNHMKRHSDERNYKCKLCDKTFKYNVALKTHQRVHNTSFPYSCNKCGQSYKWKQTYDTHYAKCTASEPTADVK